jgi:hypothetical protein
VLFAQSLDDLAVAEVVSDIERVASGLSQKIWQKIIILQELRTTTDVPEVAAPSSDGADFPPTD